MTPARPSGRFVSRGGDKLDGALGALGIDPAGMRVLDAGASTGGFSDRLLQGGAREVVAVDVAYGDLAWTLRTDPRVTVLERTNVRHLRPTDVGAPVDLIVADLSFISLATVAEALCACLAADGALLVLVKPQFELPRDRVPPGGVVRDPEDWMSAMRRVAEAYRARRLALAAATPSLLPGPKGNREFFLHMLRGDTDAGDEVIARAAREAP